ncbi:MAG: cupin domain-containing protein [Desulfobacteraceae bacterium]|nr:cupin domain-containing protein [Desulfobacteraceae bacterium]
MKIIDIGRVPSEEGLPATLKRLFEIDITDKTKFSLGVATFPPGVRIPPEGDGVHAGDEFSIIIKGEIVSVNNGKKQRLTAGHAVYIPAGESHWAVNESHEDCEIVWVLVDP